jgi:hypothetical protein
MIVTPNHFCLQEPDEREATLVLGSDGSVAVAHAAPWSLSTILARHHELLLLDYHGLQGAAKLRKDKAGQIVQFECDWSSESEHNNCSVQKALKEAGPCSTIATGVPFTNVWNWL